MSEKSIKLQKKIRGLRTLSGIFPLAAGYLAIIALACPTAYIDIGYTTWSWWMWDLIMMRMSGYPTIMWFIFQGEYIILSLVATAVILFSAINLFELSKSTRLDNCNYKQYLTRSILSAILSIGVMIYYIIAIESAFNNGLSIEGTSIFPPGYQFWDVFNPGFGIILPFISATLSLAGIVAYRYYTHQKKAIPPDELEIIMQKRQLKKLKVPVFGISALVIGGLGVFFLIYNFRIIYMGYLEFLIFPMILCIIACILGVNGRKWDASKGAATGGVTIGVIGTIASMIILVYFIFLINVLMYADI